MSGKIDEGACPKCNKKLEWDWIWAGDFDTTIVGEEDDYQSWFMVCEDCEINFNLVENKPVEITE